MKRSLITLVSMLLFAFGVFAQNTVSGEITGTVTDASGAVVPNLSVNLTNASTGVNQNTTTGSSGNYRFALLRPGTYRVTVNAPGFAPVARDVVVAVGQISYTPVQLSIAGATQTVEVTASTPLLQADNGNIATTYDTRDIELIPSPGNDITNYAYTAPGAVISTGGGYGNFTAFGLPGTSNLYTVNGNDYNDPYLNLNNSGASNMALGANELQELTVVNNGYTGEYGRAAGANVNYTTKSGTNQFHGDAIWYWNGSYLNANDWFNNNTTPLTPRPHAVSNQWAGSIGGPIKKDKLFFFYDNEGIRYVLPGGGGLVNVPSPQFEAATVANLGTTSPSQVGFYNQMFKLYNGAPGVNRATPITASQDPMLGCGDLAGTPAAGGGTFGVDVPCGLSFRSDVNNLNTESLNTFRIDWNASLKDKLNFRYKRDRGVQATGTDPINAAFNANSVQPEDDGQVNWTHVVNSNQVNQLIASGLYYSALFGPPNLSASLAVFPTTVAFVDGAPFNNVGGSNNVFPQGRNVTQWQIVDDYAWTKGNHGIKFGVNFRRNDISSFAAGPGTSGLLTINSMTDYYNGSLANGSVFSQSFANAKEQPVAYYTLGLYLQDEWRVSSKLKLTLAVRADRNSNEVCQTNCFSRPAAGSFQSISHDPSVPYNQSVQTGLHNAFPKIDPVVIEPRGGFAWTPRDNNTLVIRGGIGLFSDLYQGLIADRFITNLPNVTQFTINSGAISPGAPNSVFSQAAADNGAFHSAFANGGTLASIKASLPPGAFTVPQLNAIQSTVHNPRYLEWNLQIEKSIGSKTSVSANYVGNYGWKEFIRDYGFNTFCTPAKCPKGFQDLPSAAPDQRFGVVTQLQNGGISNYNGVVATLTRKFSYGFQGTVNYTYSHSLDDVSNGGLEPYNGFATWNSIRVAIDPFNIPLYNYASSDYDFRNVVSANYFWQIPGKPANHFANLLLGGWGVSGTIYSKGGEPFSVYSTAVRGKLSNANGGSTGNSDLVMPIYLGGGMGSCSHPSFDNNNPLQCLTTSQFNIVGQNTWGNLHRNSFRGPGYFNTDFSVLKDLRLTEKLIFTLAANAYNVLNHPNFGNPFSSLSAGNFGQLYTTVTPPNSPYGNFQGAAVSGRVLQLEAKIKF